MIGLVVLLVTEEGAPVEGGMVEVVWWWELVDEVVAKIVVLEAEGLPPW